MFVRLPTALLPLLCILLSSSGFADPSAIERNAFSSPSRETGEGAVFTRLDPERTGLLVDNAYDDPQMWRERYRAFMGGGMGSGVAVGDFDGDGRVDLYVSLKTRPGRLFRNLGGWRFADVTKEAGLAEEGSLLGWLRRAVSSDEKVVWRQGAVFADIDNDGDLDLFVSRNQAPNLLYVNQGDGTFREEGAERGLGIVDGSVIGAFADYDRDGWLDVLILTNQMEGVEPNGRADRLFRNTGEGRFVETTAQAGIDAETFGHAAVWFDYDGDGWPDLYLANDFAGPDYLYRNNGDGTFENQIDFAAPHTPYSSMGADTADVDNDGWIDLLVADMATTTREKDRRGLAASREDVLRMGTKPDMAPQYMRNALLLNTGMGVFREAAPWAGLHATDWTWSVRFEDFDNDGWTDLHVTNGMVREANNSDLLSKMMRALSDVQRISVMKQSPLLAESNLAYRNLGDGRFEEVTALWGLSDVGVSFGAATGDFDNDGDLDLVYLDYDGGLAVYRNDAPSRNRVQVRLSGTHSNRFGVGALVRLSSPSAGLQTRDLTVARGYAAGSELVAHFGLGADQRIERLTVDWPSGARQVFEDLPANFAYRIREIDASTSFSETDSATPLFSRGSAAYELEYLDEARLARPDKEQTFIPFRTDRRGPGIAVADVNGDGKEDLYLSSTTGSTGRLLLSQDAGFKPTEFGRPAVAVEEGPPLLFDADGDGHRDLLVTKASADAAEWPLAFQPVLYLNDGKGNFELSDWLPSIAVNTGAVCAADIDGDGDIDLFLGARSTPGSYPDTPRSFLLRNDGGRFVDASDAAPDLAAAGLVKSAVFRDVDQDGLPDLVLALEWDFVRFFRNEGEGRFVDRTEQTGFASGGRGWWNSLAAADFNGDGRIDFAAGNLGLNTGYQASPEEPTVLFYGDFAQDGTRLIAEAEYEKGELFPLRGRADLGTRLPFILRAYPRNDDFAKATMAEVYGEEPLANAKRYAADNFSSGVFLSQADGSYRFAPLPPIAQIGPIQGLVAADLDGDGLVDIAAVHNSDSAIPRFHGGVGVVLKGDGQGNFRALPPLESGLLATGYGKALVLMDPNHDGRPDLFYTRHGGSSELLVNDSPSAPWLKLELQGHPGNGDAIGARVEMHLTDGRTLMQETGLGGGWMSQSTPALFVALPDSVQVERVVITWPDGHEEERLDVPASGHWRIQHPAAKPPGD